MTEVRSSEADAARFRVRALVIGAVVLLAFCLVAARLVYLQVVRHEDLAAQAESNRTAVVPIVPNRGLILDRNGVVLASNRPDFRLLFMRDEHMKPKDVEEIVDRLAKLVDLDDAHKRRVIADIKNAPRRAPVAVGSTRPSRTSRSSRSTLRPVAAASPSSDSAISAGRGLTTSPSRTPSRPGDDMLRPPAGPQARGPPA